MCWNKGRLCWKTAKLFYFCHLKKVVRPETFGPYYVRANPSILVAQASEFYKVAPNISSILLTVFLPYIKEFNSSRVAYSKRLIAVRFSRHWEILDPQRATWFMSATWRLVFGEGSYIFRKFLDSNPETNKITFSMHSSCNTYQY